MNLCPLCLAHDTTPFDMMYLMRSLISKNTNYKIDTKKNNQDSWYMNMPEIMIYFKEKISQNRVELPETELNHGSVRFGPVNAFSFVIADRIEASDLSLWMHLLSCCDLGSDQVCSKVLGSGRVGFGLTVYSRESLNLFFR